MPVYGGSAGGAADGAPHVIEDEGTPLTQRANINITGAGASAADSGGKTVVTIPGAVKPAETCLAATAVSITNIPVGLQEFAGTSRYRTKVDLTNATQARITLGVATAANAGAEIRGQYSTDESTWIYLDGGTGPTVTIDATGARVSSWVNLVAGAKADVFLRAITINGDAAADPAVGTLILQFK